MTEETKMKYWITGIILSKDGISGAKTILKQQEIDERTKDKIMTVIGGGSVGRPDIEIIREIARLKKLLLSTSDPMWDMFNSRLWGIKWMHEEE